jgi:putative hydrolase of the HAD superfamily
MFSTVKAIIFDLDDTLYLQRSYKESGFSAVADWLKLNHGVPADVTLDHLYRIINDFGPSYPKMFNQLVERISLSDDYIPALIRVFLNHQPAIACFQGVKETLSRLRKSFLLGLLTDGHEYIQRKKVRCLGLENSFDSILYSDAMGLKKPASELYQFFEDQFHLHPRQLIYVGDNPNKDFSEANRRGWLTVRVKTGEYAALCCSKEMDARITITGMECFEMALRRNICLR